jgi:hypothetical protein
VSITRSLQNATRRMLGKPPHPSPGRHKAEDDTTGPTWTAIDEGPAPDQLDHKYRGQPSTHDSDGGHE